MASPLCVIKNTCESDAFVSHLVTIYTDKIRGLHLNAVACRQSSGFITSRSWVRLQDVQFFCCTSHDYFFRSIYGRLPLVVSLLCLHITSFIFITPYRYCPLPSDFPVLPYSDSLFPVTFFQLCFPPRYFFLPRFSRKCLIISRHLFFFPENKSIFRKILLLLSNSATATI